MTTDSFLFIATDEPCIQVSGRSRLKKPIAEGIDSYVAVIVFVEDIVDTKIR